MACGFTCLVLDHARKLLGNMQMELLHEMVEIKKQNRSLSVDEFCCFIESKIDWTKFHSSSAAALKKFDVTDVNKTIDNVVQDVNAFTGAEFNRAGVITEEKKGRLLFSGDNYDAGHTILKERPFARVRDFTCNCHQGKDSFLLPEHVNMALAMALDFESTTALKALVTLNSGLDKVEEGEVVRVGCEVEGEGLWSLFQLCEMAMVGVVTKTFISLLKWTYKRRDGRGNDEEKEDIATLIFRLLCRIPSNGKKNILFDDCFFDKYVSNTLSTFMMYLNLNILNF